MKKFIVSICICVISLAVQAQENPVSWTFGAEHVEGSKYLITFNAEIQKNWVLYSQNIDEGGPIPTGFFFTESDAFTLIGKVEEKSEAHTEMDELFEMKVTKFKDEAIFEQLVELKNATGAVAGELEFMTCDGNRCLPPTVVEFNIKVE